MEFIYFIAGLIFMANVVGIKRLFEIKREFDEIQDNVYLIRTHIRDEKVRMNDLVEKLELMENQLTTDSYSNIASVNQKIEENKKEFDSLVSSFSYNSKDISDRFTKLSNELQQVKANVTAIRDSTKYLDRY